MMDGMTQPAKFPPIKGPTPDEIAAISEQLVRAFEPLRRHIAAFVEAVNSSPPIKLPVLTARPAENDQP